MGLLCSNQSSIIVQSLVLIGEAPQEFEFKETIVMRMKSNSSLEEEMLDDLRGATLDVIEPTESTNKVSFVFNATDESEQSPNLRELVYNVPLDVEYQVHCSSDLEDANVQVKGSVELVLTFLYDQSSCLEQNENPKGFFVGLV